MPRSASSLTLRCREVSAGLRRAETALARLRAEFAELQVLVARIQEEKEVTPFVLHTGTRGDVLRTIFEVLRSANSPLTLREMTERVMRMLRFDADNPRIVLVMMERVRTALLRQEKAGVVRADRTGDATEWKLERDPR